MFPRVYITTEGYLVVGSLRKVTSHFAGILQKDITTHIFHIWYDVKYSCYGGVFMYVKSITEFCMV